MKKWKVPQVNVEKFMANEYVSTCQQVVPIPGGSKYWYWDWDKDKKYDTTPDESFTAALNNDSHMPTPSMMKNLNKHTWYTNQVVYWTSVMKSNDTGYETGVYEKYDVDIYVVSSSSVYIYPHGSMDTTDGDYKPDGQKSFS